MIFGKNPSYRLFLALFIAPCAWCKEPAAISILEVLKPPKQPLTMHFREEKRLQILNQPLKSHGLLRFIPPDTLVRKEDGWRDISYRIEGDQVSISEGERVLRQFDLGLSPGVAAIATTLRALLAADIQTLEKHYTLTLTGSSSEWTLLLTPRDKPASQFVKKVLIDGGNGRITAVDTYEQNGDRSHMMLMPDG
ncbi:MAG: outer membrane lipoprotein carrier protein LolA [Gammaproteobacteria bacterium]|nr:outer membrane lipoprotein carrier protein LolA [Gammaproteobacteria bacterium]